MGFLSLKSRVRSRVKNLRFYSDRRDYAGISVPVVARERFPKSPSEIVQSSAQLQAIDRLNQGSATGSKQPHSRGDRGF